MKNPNRVAGIFFDFTDYVFFKFITNYIFSNLSHQKLNTPQSYQQYH